MKSCAFAGMRDYSAHPAFTDDADDRFAAIAHAVVDSERQFDMVSDFEQNVQDRVNYVRKNATPTNPRCRGPADRDAAGTAGLNPGGPDAAEIKHWKEAEIS